MKTIIRLSFLLLYFSFANDIKPKNITVIPFEGWKYPKYSRQNSVNGREILTDKIIVRLIKTNRFNVINRENLDEVLKEQKLQFSGIVDMNTAVEIGNLIGVDKMIKGSFTGNSVEYVKEKYNKKGKKTSDAYYTANISASIKMLEVETAMYTEAVEARGSGIGNNYETAQNNALDELSKNIIKGFEKFFKIKGYLTEINKSNVIIDRGKNVGIKNGMYFEVFELNENSKNNKTGLIGSDVKKIGTMRINYVDEKYAKGRVFSGQNNIRIGNLIRESKHAFYTEAKILEKTKNKVVINAGRDLGLSKGSTFNVVETNEIKDYSTGEIYASETKNIGKIFLTEIGPNFAKGKIIKGQNKVKNGMIIKETKSLQPHFGVSLSGGPIELVSKVNYTVGTFEISNRFTGSHEVEVDYSANESIDRGFHLNISSYIRKTEYNYFGGLGLDLFNIDAKLGGWAFEGSLNKQLSLLPEIFYISPGVGFGYGQLKQSLPNDIVNVITNRYSDRLHSNSLYFSLNLNTSIYLGKINIFGGFSYRTMSFSDWYYSVKIGNKEESNESIKIPIDLVPFSKISIPAVLKIGIRYEF